MFKQKSRNLCSGFVVRRTLLETDRCCDDNEIICVIHPTNGWCIYTQCTVLYVLIHPWNIKILYSEIIRLYELKIKERLNSLIGPLKLFLFLQITVHILKNSAFRNPFVPAGRENTRKEIKHGWNHHCTQVLDLAESKTYFLFHPL